MIELDNTKLTFRRPNPVEDGLSDTLDLDIIEESLRIDRMVNAHGKTPTDFIPALQEELYAQHQLSLSFGQAVHFVMVIKEAMKEVKKKQDALLELAFGTRSILSL